MASDDKKNADKIKASNSGGFRGWWNKQGKGTIALTVLAGFCCFSLLVAMVIGFITPEHELTTIAVVCNKFVMRPSPFQDCA